MKLKLGYVYIVEVRDRVTGKRSTYFGVTEYAGDKTVYIGGEFCRFKCGWIDDEEIEWASKAYPAPAEFESEHDWIEKNIRTK